MKNYTELDVVSGKGVNFIRNGIFGNGFLVGSFDGDGCLVMTSREDLIVVPMKDVTLMYDLV